ncbi:MAG: hypothetical protein ACO1N3_03705 [Gammaproteobacteria bacterium]
MQNKPNIENLMKAATQKSRDSIQEQRIIDEMNSKNVKNAMKLTGWYDYININRAYFQARYGKYALAAAAFAVTGAYVAAFFFAPTLIPFGLATLATGYINYIITAAMTIGALYSGYIFLTSSAKEFMALVSRALNTISPEDENDKKLSKYDVALLTAATLAGAGLITMLYAFPTILPVLGNLSTWPKLGVAATAGVVSAMTGYAAYKGFFAPAPAPAPAAAAKTLSADKAHPDTEEVDENQYIVRVK